MSAIAEGLPACLYQIYQEAIAHQPAASNLDTFRPLWEAHLSRVRAQLPEAHIEAGGEVLYLGDLAPGCRACKQGTWDCVFITMRCNLDCAFCYSPHAIPRDYAGSAFGATPGEIARNQARAKITGISFSGGEPFTEPERLLSWAAWFTSHHPDKTYWVYTNGLLADAVSLQRLGELGIDEIRFNTAATGYDHPTVMANMGAAARHIPNVTVEIPAIPDDAGKLLSCLADWCALGVRYLNLHELIAEPGTNSASLPGERRPVVMPDGHGSAIHTESRALTLAVMKRVQEDGLPLSVNDCSLQSKIGQLRGRRKSMAPLVKAAHERMVDDQFCESLCAYQGEDAVFFHPDQLSEMRQRYAGYQLVRLVRTAPLSLRERDNWISVEIMKGP